MAMAKQQGWGKVSSWADESEAADAEADASFPSLQQAAKPAPGKKKNKGQTLSLSEFTTGKFVGPGARRTSSAFISDSDRLTSEELMMLPTGPKERTPDEEGRLGGGFRSYGGPGRYRADGDRENVHYHRDPPMSMPPPPSRADESADWFSGKNVRPSSAHSHRQGRFMGEREGPSKADNVESWTAGKSFVPSYEQDNWGRRPGRSEYGSRSDYGFGRSDTNRWSSDRSSESGLDQRPRLNLQPRTLPLESSSSRPSSSHSNRSESLGDLQRTQSETKPRVNPFGAAKPREMVLEERGQDWRKLDSELEQKRYETEEEKRLKEEIKRLKEIIEGDPESEAKQELQRKEQELEQITKEFDQKARIASEAPRRREEQQRRPPSSHDNRRGEGWRRPRTPSVHENESYGWRDRPRTPSLHESETGWWKDRPRTPSVHESESEYGGYGGRGSRPMTPSDDWKQQRTDFWSRPRTPDEWRRENGRRSNYNHNPPSGDRW